VQDLADGRRSITQINVSGDFLNPQSFVSAQADYSVLTLSECVVSALPHRRFEEAIADDVRLARLLWLDTALDGAMQREWLSALSRRTALEIVALLLCELYTRLDAIGLVRGDAFDLPLTQQQAADVVGLSAVHFNRTLMELRARDWLTWDAGEIHILDYSALAEAAEFDPSYLGFSNPLTS
jgi:CRP-like cAMP-binding protein